MNKGRNRKNPLQKCDDPYFAVYSEEELAFLKAMDRYKQITRRPYPTLSEVLEVAKSLGYRKIVDTPIIIDNSSN